MKVLAIVHEDDAGPGVFGQAAEHRGWEVLPWRIAEGEPCPAPPESCDAVLSLGGAMHAHQREAHPWLADEETLLAELVAAGRPVLGICLGAQLLARATGGTSSELAVPEIGWFDIKVTEPGGRDALLGPLQAGFSALEWHSCDFAPGPGAEVLATSERCTQACRVGPRAWSVQFHAEVTGQDFEAWLDEHLARGDGVPDAEGLRALTRARIDSWNALGRALFGRFLEVASAG